MDEPLASIITTDGCSLQNYLDELQASLTCRWAYGEAGLTCFWFNTIAVFSEEIRVSTETGSGHGAGLPLHRLLLCLTDWQLLAGSCRPKNLPRELGQLLAVALVSIVATSHTHQRP